MYNNDIILIYEGLALYVSIGRKYLLTHTRCVRGVIMKGYLKKKIKNIIIIKKYHKCDYLSTYLIIKQVSVNANVVETKNKKTS